MRGAKPVPSQRTVFRRLRKGGVWCLTVWLTAVLAAGQGLHHLPGLSHGLPHVECCHGHAGPDHHDECASHDEPGCHGPSVQETAVASAEASGHGCPVCHFFSAAKAVPSSAVVLWRSVGATQPLPLVAVAHPHPRVTAHGPRGPPSV